MSILSSPLKSISKEFEYPNSKKISDTIFEWLFPPTSSMA